MLKNRKLVSECNSLAEYRVEVLSARRRVKCVSQVAIAKKMGCKQAYVSAVEKGKVKLLAHDPKTQEWAEAYDLTVAQFLRMVWSAIEKKLSWSPGPLFETRNETPANVVSIDFSAYVTSEERGVKA